MIEAIKITDKEFIIQEAKITKVLRGLKTFNSKTYQERGIETTDGLVLLLKPKREDLLKAIEPLKIEWKEFSKDVILNIE